jgi:putative effector of murein hydrolase
MYKQAMKLKGTLRRLFIVVLAGSIVGMVSSGVVAWLFGAPPRMIMSAIPKSVTTPIAIEVSKELHGDPTITAALVLISGVLGSVAGPELLRRANILHKHAVGAAVGTASHALGTATLIRRCEVQGAVSSLAMTMTGVITSVLASLWMFWMH